MSKIDHHLADKISPDPIINWDKLRIFHNVAEAGSFTHAGERLNLSQSAVSRQISALEDILGVLLFHRHARGLILTEQGEILHLTVREVFSKLALTQAFLSENKEKASGKITVTTTSEFGISWLIPRLKYFYQKHPEVTINLLLEDADLDLSMREADVAVRMHPPTQPDLIQRHLARFNMPLYASKDYLKKHPIPQNLNNLSSHCLISFKGAHPPLPKINWLLELITQEGHLANHRLTVNNLAGLNQAIIAGIGIGSLPSYIADHNQNLIKILPDITSPPIDAYFVYPEELRSSKRIAVFRDFLLHKLQEEKSKS